MWPTQQMGMQPGFPMNFAQTTIRPQSIYPRALTQQTINQQRASLSQQYNPLTMAKQFDRPGVSRGPQTSQRMAPLMAQGFAEQAAVGPNQQFADAGANQQNMLQGQVARDQEARQWAEIMARLQNSQWGKQFNNLQAFMGLLGNYA